MDLREQIAEKVEAWFNEPDDLAPNDEMSRQVTDAVMAVVQPEIDRLRAHILDIDAHATPYGDIPDDPGYTGVYLVTAGALHRALGTIGHSAPKCQAEAVIKRVSAHLAEYETGDWGARGTLVKIRAEITPTIEALDQPGDQEGTTP